MSKHYEQLNDLDREQLDDAYRDLQDTLREAGLPICGDDTAERVIDAIAAGILESREKLKRRNAERAALAETVGKVLKD